MWGWTVKVCESAAYTLCFTVSGLASWFATQVEQHKHEAGPWAQVQPYLAQTAEQQQSAINSMLQ